MGTPLISSNVSSLEDLQGIHLNPFEEMDGMRNVRLDPPPTKKWVKFEDWDEEALEYSGNPGRRHSSHDINLFSSSVSSETSLGSAGEGGKSVSQLSSIYRSLDEPAIGNSPQPESMFLASFGGYRQNGDAASLRTLFKPPTRKSLGGQSKPISSAPSSTEGVATPPRTITFSAFNELTSFQTRFSELSVCEGRAEEEEEEEVQAGHLVEEETTGDLAEKGDQIQEPDHQSNRYSVFEGLREEGGYHGWSNHVLGTTFGWSDQIKREAPKSLPLRSPTEMTSGPQGTISEGEGSDGSVNGERSALERALAWDEEVSVVTLSTPEMTGLRTISWPRSPTRSFVRNFP